MSLRSFYYLANIWRTPYASCEDIENLQLKKLRQVVTHAYENSPFYHEKFAKAGVNPADITSLKDITKIPFTTKKEIREAQNNIIARNIPLHNCYRETTSGSTGKKLVMYHSVDFKWFRYALFYRMYINWGMKPFKKLTYIRFSPSEPTLLDTLGIAKTFYISSFLDTDTQFKLLCGHDPHILVAHPPDLVTMARMQQELSTSLQFDFAVSNSELLTQKEREYIEEVFNCPVYEEYSSFEVGFMARNCKKKNMHIISDSVILEFVKDGEVVSPGEQGEVVVTSLFKNATPFIRYYQGDVASESKTECDCGITFPLMNVIEGRKDDFLVLPSGKKIPPTRVVPIFFNISGIKEFNVIQVSLTKVVINVVLGDSFEEREEEYLLELIKKELPGMDIDIQHVNSIERTAHGKKRAVINTVS
ncbi:MAG: hypothetical protein PVF58_16490 [Candidatus Methanofastidiosia archaeon]|jgi:phenylacetate-CoA ligase